MRLIADTSGIVTALDADQPGHDQALAALQDAAVAVVTPQVIAETCHVLTRLGVPSAVDGLLEDVAAGFYELWNPEPHHYSQARESLSKYRGAIQRKRPKPDGLDLADAMNLIAADRFGIEFILTTDSDYRQARTPGGKTLAPISLMRD
ncbi:MAG: PIN domain-containing protein [Propionibacteriaceae bacterium]|jgi:predicted nucleic acid-binding protein|nr:PIN domain-containing protein [Propionibacteriaceae bacterium]